MTPPLNRRDYFAAMALQGLLAGRYQGSQVSGKDTAEIAVLIADDLIAELDKFPHPAPHD